MTGERVYFPQPRPLTAPPPDAPTMVEVVRHLTGNCESTNCIVGVGHPPTVAVWRDARNSTFIVCDRHRRQYDERTDDLGPFDWVPITTTTTTGDNNARDNEQASMGRSTRRGPGGLADGGQPGHARMYGQQDEARLRVDGRRQDAESRLNRPTVPTDGRTP